MQPRSPSASVHMTSIDVTTLVILARLGGWVRHEIDLYLYMRLG